VIREGTRDRSIPNKKGKEDIIASLEKQEGKRGIAGKRKRGILY